MIKFKETTKTANMASGLGMDIESLVNSIPNNTDLEAETYRDNRVRLHLLYREGEERLDVLITPFGENLKEKKDITTYMRFLPNNEILSSVAQDVELNEVYLRDDSKYLTLRDENNKVVLPFKSKEFPTKIMPSSFTSDIVKCNNGFLETFVTNLEYLFDFSLRSEIIGAIGKRPSFSEVRSDIKELRSLVRNMVEKMAKTYSPLREPIMEAFEGVESPSVPLNRFRRKVKHYYWKDIESECFGPDSFKYQIIKYLVQNRFLNPVRHSFYSTEENKIFGISHSKKNIEQWKALLDYLEEESPKAYFMLEKTLTEKEGNAASTYHKYLFLGGLGSLCFGNLLTSAGLFGLYLAEKNVSKHNSTTKGYHTGIIGTARDKLGLTKKYVSPFDLISIKYDMGMWREEDL